MLYKGRERFDSIGIKIGSLFSRLRLSPNQWTVLSILPALISFYLLTRQEFFLAALFFSIASFIDWIDGSVARVTGKATAFGGFLDVIMDRVVEFLIIFGLSFIEYPDFIIPAQKWLMLILFGSFMIPYLKASAFWKITTKEEISGGILERTERLILLFLIILTSAFSTFYSIYLIVITVILLFTSAIQRFIISYKKR